MAKIIDTPKHWHVAPVEMRESIAQNGIDHTHSEHDYYGHLEYPAGNYLFTNESAAFRYKEIRDEEELDAGGDFAGHDVWLVTGSIDTIRDPFHDDESGLGRCSVYVTDAIPCHRIQLLTAAESLPNER